jgi:hypothetical protein
MLAVKFHHLRALIHRSFLCLPLLQVKNRPSGEATDCPGQSGFAFQRHKKQPTSFTMLWMKGA